MHRATPRVHQSGGKDHRRPLSRNGPKHLRWALIGTTMDPLEWLRKQLEEADTDLLGEMVRTFVQALASAEADAIFDVGKVCQRCSDPIEEVFVTRHSDCPLPLYLGKGALSK